MGKEKKEILEENEVITSTPVNCLKNERVIVRFLPKQSGIVTDPKHVLFGGMADKAVVTYCTPLLRSGEYKDVLTKDEKDCLEKVMGLEHNSLSVYKKNDNFWSSANPTCNVRLTKGDNILDLSKPEDYIKYKILLSNKDFIAPSMNEVQERNKATYKFVIIRESDTTKDMNIKVSRKAKAYMYFGKINEDWDKMASVIELMEGRAVATGTKLDYLQGKLGELLDANPKLFLQIVADSYFDTKCLIKKSVKRGLISMRGDYYYLKESGMPLCEDGQNPTLGVAAAFISNPKNQELKFSLEAKTK